ncbi:Peptidase family M48 [Nocardioides dokdonensis FR1436]|uniref:Peptidase family M48 n=1 Tax=Nocardioides dokdonensis FR1436 TaxID=1300347 RepID=A0A1A9GS75_9ACTN|nr:M56 family metallopeptidase [Nocardioides dokdonensis]ANH40442.1 Peptidase family M48 [Nocardioides dokdonensis FR1436]
MIVPALLLMLAGGVGVLGPRWLGRATWVTRSPRLGILAWQVQGAAVLLALVLAGLVLAVPIIPMGSAGLTSTDMSGLLHACTMMLRDHYATSGGVAAALLGAGWVGLVLTRFGATLARHWWRAGAERRRHRDLVDALAVAHLAKDVVVIDEARPTVYCIAGRSPRVVVSQGAMDALSAEQLEQVLVHERAHLRARHHRAVLVARAFSTAWRGRFGSSVALARICDLVEMDADDAGSGARRSQLVEAVLTLAGARGGSAGSVALAASGGGVVERVRRLVEPVDPVTPAQRRWVTTVLTAQLSLPLALALGPALAGVLLHWCGGL